MTKNKSLLFCATILALLFMSFIFSKQEPWNPFQLLEPRALAEIISDPDQPQPLIISIGPSGLIKGSVAANPAKEKENIDKLRTMLTKEPRDRNLVIYCGCCPFKDCPNIRPAFTLLNEMGFKNHKLLNLPQNLKVNWIDKGYPMN